ncbi:hypothetical protein ABB37_08337 [Leptomonas pyrrhocoris]|uniref:Uncharacterized protein n=1 Tax=Leptomonas pyrrhocoris TaxID=157538 RepID=A0A0N0VDJ8_LEPPY|nr:hypothetical protein ABB37_08337 [Leptomonas pyrrhocoris]KPA75821.1 hypothetical protein ABB37_08337 [Leptomonas pyrrhocoris]|eukprot:XP_015654260.1 hypothetical protein ABB37_08337 [Leptomonas pyrrhocoris]
MENEEGSGHPQRAPAPSATARPPTSTVAAVSDASVVAQLLEASREYDAAKSEENYTRLLLRDELLRSSATVRGASSAARHRLHRHHAALRHVSLSHPLAQAALEQHVRFVGRGQRRSRHVASRDSQAADALDVLREVEAFLTTPHFTWWMNTVAASGPLRCSPPPPDSPGATYVDPAEKHADALTGPTHSPLPPAALQTTVERLREQRSEGAVAAAELDTLLSAVEAVEDEEVTAAAYAEKRKTADAAAYAAAKRATLAGCPLPDGGAPSPVSVHPTSGCSPSPAAVNAAAAPLCTEGQLEDVDLVMQPVLGGGVRLARLHPNTTTDGDAPDCLTCVVCELEGVLTADDVRTEDRYDVLVACATCGALVHQCCACTGEACGEARNFCCRHCLHRAE